MSILGPLVPVPKYVLPHHREAYSDMLEELAALPPVRGNVKSPIALEMLYRVFILMESRDKVVSEYMHLGVKRSYLNRIVSKKQGWDSSRRPAERALFVKYSKKFGVDCPFWKYDCPPSKRRKFNNPHHARVRHHKSEKGFKLLNQQGTGHGR